jgi:hypothetical protein
MGTNMRGDGGIGFHKTAISFHLIRPFTPLLTIAWLNPLFSAFNGRPNGSLLATNSSPEAWNPLRCRRLTHMTGV